MGLIQERFNMEGNDPTGRKVGLLDRHHLMAFLCDSFCHSWRDTFKIQTPLPVLMREMIDLFVPVDDDDTCTSCDRIMKEFMVIE